jgi:hypothetical protein
MKIAEQYEQVGQGKLPAKTVRETLAELYREIYNESLPSATIRRFIENRLSTKQPELSPATFAFYKESTAKLLELAVLESHSQRPPRYRGARSSSSWPTLKPV